ncbi:MAG: FhaA domain-containing protein [Solirubrobacteraceae bacterium]
MSVLSRLESKIAGLVEGTFSRAFRSEVRPVEIARKLVREMEEHRTVSLHRTYVPNEYRVYLSARDRDRLSDYEDALVGELVGFLLEHARNERLVLLARPTVAFETDERLGLGEFGIETRAVSPRPAPAGDNDDHFDNRYEDRYDDEAGPQPGPGATVVQGAPARGAPSSPGTALLVLGGRRLVVGPAGATIGRSRDCDIVVDDPNISRAHAECRPAGGSWELADLGSTNGTRLNGHRVRGTEPLAPGDEIEVGTTRLRFELE